MASNSTTIRVHNKNTSYKKLGKKKYKFKDNNIESTVRKYPSRKITSTLPQKLQNPLTNIDSLIEPSDYSSYSTNYSSSSDWKINSESDISSINQKISSSRKTINSTRKKHNTIKNQYFAQVQDRLNKTKIIKRSVLKNSTY